MLVIANYSSKKPKCEEFQIFVALTIVADNSGLGLLTWVVLTLLEEDGH